MRKNVFLFSLLFILCPVMAAAQEAVKTDTVRAELQSDFLETVGDSTDLIVAGEGSNNWFITLWGGVNSLAAEANRHYDNFLDRSRVSFRLSVGKWFTPVWGFRLQMGVGRLSGHSHLLKYYNMYDHAVDHTVIPSEIADNVFYVNGVDWFERKFTYMDWSVNAMTDVVRWFAKERKRVGLVLAMGPGYVHTFSSQGLSAGNSFAFNAGVHLNVNLNENWDILAGFQGMIVDESFDSQVGGLPGVRNRTLEGYGGLSLGVSYKFGGRKFARYAKVQPITYESVRYMLPPKVVEVTKYVDEDVVTSFAVRFFIDQYNIEDDQKLNIDRIARYLKRHPGTKLEMVGYADRETAYPEYNQKLSERRVNAVRDYLVDECGIDPSRLVMDARGDKERVYNEDYRWNRVVVMRVIENDANK